MKIDRLFTMIYILMDKQTVTARELAQQFGVSERTIYRDVDILSANGIPIYTLQGKGGGICVLERFSMDKTMLTEEEQSQILIALQSMKAMEGMGQEKLLTKLGGLFKKQKASWVEIDFTSWTKSEQDKIFFHTIRDAIEEERSLTFLYFSTKGEDRERIVDPVKLILKGQSIYLYGYCRLRKDFRFFKLSRMSGLQAGEKESCQRKWVEDDVQNNLLAGYAYEKNQEEQEIILKLKFGISVGYRIFDELCEEKIIQKEDCFLIEESFLDNEQLYRYLLGFGNEVEILEPQEAREKLLKKIEEIKRIYL